MLLGVSDRKLETSVTPYKVSWSVPNNSATLRSMVRSFRCLPAAPACGLLPSAAAQSGPHARTTDPAVPVLADASGACRTLRPCGQGGGTSRAAARERACAPQRRSCRCGAVRGRCEVARGRSDSCV
ncbi:hypothetical protein OAO87_00935 [bacterium]|nr:hypothetical protein [bacterium]